MVAVVLRAGRTWNLPTHNILTRPRVGAGSVALWASSIAVPLAITRSRILLALLWSRDIVSKGSRLSVVITGLVVVVAVVVATRRTRNSRSASAIVTLAALRVCSALLASVVVGTISSDVGILVMLLWRGVVGGIRI